eukprot:Nk52_evm5s215 gene=Nk52_evmTU5s215
MPAIMGKRRMKFFFAIVATIAFCIVAISAKTIVRVGIFEDVPSPIKYGAAIRAYDDATYEFHFYGLQSGIEALRKLERGDLEFTLIGSSPYSQAVYRGMEVTCFAVELFLGQMEGAIIKTSSGVISPLDFKRKDKPKFKMATPQGSTAHLHALYGFHIFSVNVFDDVELVFAQPGDLGGLWDSGAIDGMYVWDPARGTALANGGKEIYASDLMGRYGSINSNVFITTKTYMANNKAAIQRFMNVQGILDEHFLETTSVSLYNPNGANFNAAILMMKGVNGLTDPGHPYGLTPELMGSIRSFGVQTRANNLLHLQNDLKTTVEQTGAFLEAQKILATRSSTLNPQDFIDTTVLQSAISSNSETYAGLTTTAYTVTATTSAETCTGSTTKSVTAASQTHQVFGNVDTTKTCTFVFKPTSASDVVILEWSQFNLENEGVVVYAGEGTSGNVLMAHTGGQLPPKLAYPGTVTMTVALLANGVFTRYIGFGTFGEAVLQGLTMTYKTGTVCTSDTDCGTGTCSNGMCSCPEGYSGAACSKKYCGGTREYTASTGTFKLTPSTADKYPGATRCSFQVKPTGAKMITLTFSNIDIETGYDALTISSVSGGTASVVQSINAVPADGSAVIVQVNTEQLNVDFVASFVGNRVGATVSYTSATSTSCTASNCVNGGSCTGTTCTCPPGYYGEGCYSSNCLADSGTSTSYTGSILSNGGQYYSTISTNCVWKFNPPTSRADLPDTPALTGMTFNIHKLDLEVGGDPLTITGLDANGAVAETKVIQMTANDCTTDENCNLHGTCTKSTVVGASSFCTCEANWYNGQCNQAGSFTVAGTTFTVNFGLDLNNQGKNLEGFNMTYAAVYPCPNNCSSHGTCVAGVCNCESGFEGASCTASSSSSNLIVIIAAAAGGGVALIILIVVIVWYRRKKAYENELLNMSWRISYEDLSIVGNTKSRSMGSRLNASTTSNTTQDSGKSVGAKFAVVAKYHESQVAIRVVLKESLELTREVLQELKEMSEIRHPNINGFIGACIDPPNLAIVTEYCPKGSLEDIVQNDHINLTWMFKFSLATDLAKGMQYIHSSFFETHGSLKSSNCLIDGRWTLRIADFGYYSFRDGEQQSEEVTDYALMRRKLWMSPEILEEPEVYAPYGSWAGDVWAYGVILSEIINRDTPYCEATIEMEDLLEEIKNGNIIPTVSDGTECPPEVEEIMNTCFAPDPDERPQFSSLYKDVRKANPDRNANIMDNMAKMLEEYASNLEGLVEARTALLHQEQAKTAELLEKTDMLLAQMLPRSIADKLKAGEKVAPESFTECSIFFSDIVGFTNIAGGSTPLQVVDLLNDLYTAFDSVIDNFDVYKVETIGDAYMVVSGIPIRNDNRHAGEIGSMALELLHACVGFKIRHMPEKQLQLRVGIHSGPAVAGVVGLKMPRYCLFGDTVNTASRMESGGLALRIHMSASTQKILQQLGGYHIETRGELEVKGKGTMITYWLNGKDGFTKELPDLNKAAGLEEHTFK